MPYVLLADRASLLVTGEAAGDFLQALVTSDVEAVAPGEARPSALLTPQGKILFDFLVSRTEHGFRLDVASGARGDLAKRLRLYRLRTKVEIEPAADDVFAVWDVEDAGQGSLVDQRFPGGAVLRSYGAPPPGVPEAEPNDFAAMRLRAGVAEAERDFPASDVFPHDVLLDQNGGVSFRKGCYVGQEVVSRMQHRGTARRRLMLVAADGHLTPGANVMAADSAIGTVLSAIGSEGIALLRIDRLASAIGANAALTVDGVPVDATIPSWAGYALPLPGAGTGQE